MTTTRRVRLIQRLIKEVNEEAGMALIYMFGKATQWEIGNVSIQKYKDGFATLSINVRVGDLKVGCDGLKPGINDYLKRNHIFLHKNGQNTRYQCDDDKLKAVIRHYAHMGETG